MSIQSISSQFRTFSNLGPPNNFVSLDDLLNVNGGGMGVAHTGGEAIIDQALLGGPETSQKWTFLSASVQGYLALLVPATATAPFGKLGKIIAGFTLSNDLSPTSGVDIFTSKAIPSAGPPMPPLPRDTSLLSTLWDPALDPLPPVITPPTADPSFTSYLPMSCLIAPPNPIPIVAGVSPLIGIWMTDSLLGLTNNGKMGLILFGANYTVNYNDNR